MCIVHAKCETISIRAIKIRTNEYCRLNFTLKYIVKLWRERLSRTFFSVFYSEANFFSRWYLHDSYIAKGISTQDELCVRRGRTKRGKKNCTVVRGAKPIGLLEVRGRLTQPWNRKRRPVKSWKWFGQIEELNPSIARRIQYESRSVRLRAESTLPTLSQSFPIFYLSRIHFACRRSPACRAQRTSSRFKILVQENLSKFLVH